MHKCQWSIGIFLIVLLSASACRHEQELLTIESGELFRQIAWDLLTPEQKATVIEDWRSADVRLQEYRGENLVWFIFNTVDDALLGPIIVLIDPATYEVAGIIPRL